MTTVTTWAVLLRERDSDDYTLEATYRGLVCPTPEGGPYLAQEGDVFLVVVSMEVEPIVEAEETLATTEAEMLREVGEIRDRLGRLEDTIKRLQHG